MIEFKCHQTAYSTHVTLNDGAVVTISRAVGSPKARALMNLCAGVLNGDMLSAQQALDRLMDDDEPVRVTMPATSRTHSRTL